LNDIGCVASCAGSQDGDTLHVKNFGNITSMLETPKAKTTVG
jgi:hypothetical protein